MSIVSKLARNNGRRTHRLDEMHRQGPGRKGSVDAIELRFTVVKSAMQALLPTLGRSWHRQNGDTLSGPSGLASSWVP